MATKDVALAEYRGKRNPRRNGEPTGRGRRRGGDPQLVVQHHLASTDHYDFPLEVDGVPDGAGAVQVWDTGSYRNGIADHGKSVEIAEALRRGDVSFELDGQKLHGGFALIRMCRGRDETWLLVKKSDRYAGKPIRATTKSALSGRTLRRIEAEGP